MWREKIEPRYMNFSVIKPMFRCAAAKSSAGRHFLTLALRLQLNKLANREHLFAERCHFLPAEPACYDGVGTNSPDGQ